MGEYHLAEDYQYLCVDKQKFFQMNEVQRERHLKRLFQEHTPENSSFVQPSAGENPLLVLTSVPEYVLTRAWEGSEGLSSSSICQSPGSSENEWLVKSSNPKHKAAILCGMQAKRSNNV